MLAGPLIVDVVAPGVERVFQPDDHPMHGGGCATYLVGDAAPVLIDTGTGDPGYTRGLVEHLGERRLAGIWLTHGHRDHIGGVPDLLAVCDGPIVAHAAVFERLPTLPVERRRPVTDGAVLAGDGWRLEVLETPGHSPDSLTYIDAGRRLAFTGDTILGEGSTSVTDLAPYLASLQRLRGRDLERLAPGHGPIVQRAQRKIVEYLRHRRLREREVLQAIATPACVDEIIAAIYPQLDERIHFAAQRNVEAHLVVLVGDGRARQVGERWEAVV